MSEHEQTVVVCMPHDTDTPFDDNVEGRCFECKRRIIWRPAVPEPSIKVCMDCGLEGIQMIQEQGGEIDVREYEGQREEMDRMHGPGALERAMKMAKQMIGAEPVPQSFYDLTKEKK